jgi:tetratricopeptide (TPR) repeat protein
VLFLRPGLSGGSSKERVAELERAYAALEAAGVYLEILPALYPASEGLPKDGGRDLLPVLERLCSMSPDNYLLLAELARLRLLQGRAAQAKDTLERVVSLEPDFAQAYDLRGLCLLWMELPSLAVADFDRAIRLEPYHPGFFENRALARRILEDIPGMCEDLSVSCRLGECGGLGWAAAQGLCKE